MAYRNKKSLDELRINDDGFPTRTTEEQVVIFAKKIQNLFHFIQSLVLFSLSWCCSFLQTKVEDSVIMNHEVLSEISDSISE